MYRLLSSRCLALAAGLAALAVLLYHGPARTADIANPDKASVERTREKVRMLDDVYKGFVVVITDTYVKAQEQTPAAKVAKKVFQHMASKGWHRARLVDATGDPLNRNNLPKTDFEKRAIAKLKSGKDYFEEIALRDQKPVLRAATPVPVVMKECLTCHPGLKQGDLLGALIYEIPIK
jgi:hypothetical protein